MLWLRDWRYQNDVAKTRRDPTLLTCEDNERPLRTPPPSIRFLADVSQEIVVAEVVEKFGQPEYGGLQVKAKVTHTLKHSQLKPGQTIALCPGELPSETGGASKTLLLFLSAHDTHAAPSARETGWVPTWGGYSVITQQTDDTYSIYIAKNDAGDAKIERLTIKELMDRIAQ